jgi:hypothetical protein
MKKIRQSELPSCSRMFQEDGRRGKIYCLLDHKKLCAGPCGDFDDDDKLISILKRERILSKINENMVKIKEQETFGGVRFHVAPGRRAGREGGGSSASLLYPEVYF